MEKELCVQNVQDWLFQITAQFTGGLNLTLGGYGFSTKDVVYVGDSLCPILSSSSTQIDCLIPPPVSISCA